MVLSQRRADAVKSYMVSKGVSASRLTTTAKGESQPKVKGTSVEARAENRRVQFMLNR
jgi:outer membrane protein OmpA-like peptidoglycan-associated protein